MQGQNQVAELLRQAWLDAPHDKDKARAFAACLRDAGHSTEACNVYRETLRHHPADRDLLTGLARVLYDLGEDRESCDIFITLAAACPDDIDIQINAGKICKNAGFYAQAESCYRRALALRVPEKLPLAAFNYAHLLLAQQRWQAGFTAYEARLSLPATLLPPFGLPVWTPALPPGKSILLWSEQGLGDAIMFARFIPRLRDKGYRLSLLVQEPLQRLFDDFPGLDRVYGPLDLLPVFDAALALGSMPFALSVEPFWDAPYLMPRAEPVLPAAAVPRVGLVWSGNQAHANNKNRSLDLAALAPLLDIAGATGIAFFSLQKDGAQPLPENLHDLSPLLTDMAATAALIAQLDLVISVDTSVAHLAGALGKKTWLLLPGRDCDWRWGLSKSANIWYPSMTHFRQTKAGEWDAPIADIAARLRDHDF